MISPKWPSLARFNLERRADLEQARDILNDVHVALGTLLERENVLRRDGVMEAEAVSERFHYHEGAVRAMEGTIRQEMRADGLTAQQIEDRDPEVVSRAERRIEKEQRAYLEAHPDLLARPGYVIDRSEPYRETITDAARASEITREVDRIMEGRDLRTPVADAVADDLRARYPDMPSHLARGLGATYAAFVEIRDTEAINQVRRETEMRDGFGSGTRDALLAARGETASQSDRADRLADEISRVLDHERAGELSAPFETEAERDAFRDEIARVLDNRQLDRLTSGDADALEKVLEDRLDRLYVAKVYLQSDAATANTEALRQVVDDLADTEYEKHRATDVDGETERGQVALSAAMGKARIATGVLLVTMVTAAIGYTIASAVLSYQDLGFGAEIDFAYIAQNYTAILDRRPEDAQLIHLIIGSFAAAGLMLSLALSGSALTRFGQTHWQTAREMKANGFFGRARDRVHPRRIGPPELPRKIHLLEGLPACADRGPHGPWQDHGLRHSEPADLARLRRDARCEGRVL